MNTNQVDINIETLYPPDLLSLISKIAVTQTHFLLLNPIIKLEFDRLIINQRRRKLLL